MTIDVDGMTATVCWKAPKNLNAHAHIQKAQVQLTRSHEYREPLIEKLRGSDQGCRLQTRNNSLARRLPLEAYPPVVGLVGNDIQQRNLTAFD